MRIINVSKTVFSAFERTQKLPFKVANHNKNTN